MFLTKDQEKAIDRVLLLDGWHDVANHSFTIDVDWCSFSELIQEGRTFGSVDAFRQIHFPTASLLAISEEEN